MDKWRRVAHELPQEYIWANIAGFEAYVVSHDTLVRTHKVIVGNPKTKTPEIISNINIVVLNPDWSVPYSIIKNEMRHKSAGYLSKYNIYQDGKKVSPGQVKWGKAVRIVQPPGDNNALGYIKFLFPNSHSVYLHDTPSRNLFANSVRAYSHGCVRVHEPLLLGEYLLKRDGKDIGQDSIQSIIATHKTINYNLKNTMPVYLLYFTANVNSKNELVLYPDIYKKEDYDVSVLFNGHYKIPANTRKLKKTVPGKDIRQKEASEADSNVIAMQAEKRVLYAMF
jgi:murein L,D-transpeptidase YcbB/YkuD